MTIVIPRWEWRTFGPWFGAAEAAFAALTPTGVQESDELYLLSAAGDNVKVRDDLMDIKRLEETDADGLERWTPIMKAAFPLAASDASKVLEALRIPAPRLERDAFTLDEFLAELAEPSGVTRAVRVHKRRVRYEVGGCAAEVSEVLVDGRATRTIAIESPNAAAVKSAVRSVGLAGYLNISYPSGLAAIVDGTPARYAVIDVGTNSVKFHVAEPGPDGTWRSLADRAEITRLGEGLAEDGVIGEPAIERTALAIEGMVSEAKQLGAVAIAAVGTAGLRMAANGGAVVAAIEARTGVIVEVISGDEESRLAYLAVVSGLALAGGSLVVFDTGGGSTQFTFGHAGKVDDRFSLDVGAARYTEQFGLDRAVSTDVLKAARAAIAADLARIAGRPSPGALVGMGGAITNLTAVKLGLARYDPDRVQGARLERTEIEQQVERYRSLDAEGRRSIVGLQPKRAEVILAGACIVATVLRLLGHESLTVSDRALRHGLLAERFRRPVPTTGATPGS